MRKKAFLAGALLALWGISAVPVGAAEEIQLIINNQLYTQAEHNIAPQLLEERVYVPLRFVSESLGYQVQWFEASRQVHIATDTAKALSDNQAEPVAEDAPITLVIDGVTLTTDAASGQPFIAETGYTMIPLRVVGESLNCDVVWQDSVVIVNERQPEPVIPATSKEEEQNNEVDHAENPYYDLTIQGDNIATAAQLNAYLKRKEPDIRLMMERNYPDREFIPFSEDISELYISIGKKYHIRGDLAFAQALKETGYFQFYGSVQSFQNNFCGLGASGVENTGQEVLNGVDQSRVYSIAGLHGLTYLTVADGVEAHIQHLYAYTTDADLPDGCELLDPRFNFVKRGVAKRWVDLDGRWAIPGNGYGESIIGDYWMPAIQ